MVVEKPAPNERTGEEGLVITQTALRPQIATPLKCRWPRSYHPKPLWYERELEALERQEASLWAEYERTGAPGVRGKHGRVVGRILKLHEVLLRGEA